MGIVEAKEESLRDKAGRLLKEGKAYRYKDKNGFEHVIEQERMRCIGCGVSGIVLAINPADKVCSYGD